MKILLFSMYYTPDVPSDAPLMSKLTQELAKLGHELTVVCSFPHYKLTRLPETYRWKLFEVEHPYDNCRIIRTWVFVPPNQRVFFRFLNYLSFMLCALLAGILSGPTDRIIVYTPPPSNGIAAYLVSLFWRARIVYNVQDIYPDIGIKLGYFKSRWMIRFSQALENFLYAKSGAITVISPGFKNNLLAKGVKEEKLHIIFNWVDSAFIKPLPFEDSLRRARNWEEKFVVLYSGNIGLSQNLEELLELAKLKRLPENILFVIIGEGLAKQKLEEQASRLQLRNVEFGSFLPFDQVPLLYASANASLVMLRSEVVNESLPAKMASIMASGRPVLGVIPPSSDTWKIIAESNSGLCIEPGRLEDFLKAVLQLYHDSELCYRLGQNGRKWVEENCDPQRAALNYQAILASLS